MKFPPGKKRFSITILVSENVNEFKVTPLDDTPPTTQETVGAMEIVKTAFLADYRLQLQELNNTGQLKLELDHEDFFEVTTPEKVIEKSGVEFRDQDDLNDLIEEFQDTETQQYFHKEKVKRIAIKFAQKMCNEQRSTCAKALVKNSNKVDRVMYKSVQVAPYPKTLLNTLL